MDQRRMQRLVGAVVLFTVTFLGILLVMNNPASSPFRSGGYTIYIDLDRAPGVSVNTPVRKDGVLVGRVTGVNWTDDGVRLEVRIERGDVHIYEDDRPQVVPSSIFGDAVVQFVRTPRRPLQPVGGESLNFHSPQPGVPFDVLAQVLPDDGTDVLEPAAGQRALIRPGSVVRGEALDDPLTAIVKLNQNLSPSIEKLGEAGEKVAQLADKINQALGDEITGTRISTVLDELTVTLRDFRRTTNNVDSLIADPELREQLKQGLREFPAVMADARGVLQHSNESLAAFDRVVGSAGTNLENLEGLTEPLGRRGAEIADLLISAIENLDVVMGDLSRFSKSLSAGEGTLGRLVNDPVLYNNANLLVQDLDVVVRAIHHDVIAKGRLRKIVDDIGIFVDKIAREPGRIVGGAINPSIRK
jgi:phospholipid/cholesterol/gamma-HCH transport system substrate-binding protein